MDLEPLALLDLERFAAGGRKSVGFAPASVRLSLPARADQPFGIEPVEDRVEHGFRPLPVSAGDFEDILQDLVAVPFPAGENRQDQRPGRSSFELSGYH